MFFFHPTVLISGLVIKKTTLDIFECLVCIGIYTKKGLLKIILFDRKCWEYQPKIP